MSSCCIICYHYINGLAGSVLISNSTLGIGGDAVGGNGRNGLLSFLSDIDGNSIEGDGFQAFGIEGIAISVNITCSTIGLVGNLKYIGIGEVALPLDISSRNNGTSTANMDDIG